MSNLHLTSNAPEPDCSCKTAEHGVCTACIARMDRQYKAVEVSSGPFSDDLMEIYRRAWEV